MPPRDTTGTLADKFTDDDGGVAFLAAKIIVPAGLFANGTAWRYPPRMLDLFLIGQFFRYCQVGDAGRSHFFYFFSFGFGGGFSKPFNMACFFCSYEAELLPENECT